MSDFNQAIKRRKFLHVNDNTQLNTATETERQYFKQLLFGTNTESILIKMFTPNGLLEPEKVFMGVPMFRFETDIESPKVLAISIFFLAIKAYNTSNATRAALEAIYKDTLAENVCMMLDAISFIEQRLSFIGMTSSVSVGTNCLVSCTIQGFLYDGDKNIIFSGVFPKEFLLEPDWEPRNGEYQNAYVTFIYKKLDRNIRFAIYFVLTSLTYEKVLVDLLRDRFCRERALFLDYLADDNSDVPYFGSVQRIGRCKTVDIKASTLDVRGTVLDVIKLERFCVDIGNRQHFL